jgi:hypothetical protein
MAQKNFQKRDIPHPSMTSCHSVILWMSSSCHLISSLGYVAIDSNPASSRTNRFSGFSSSATISHLPSLGSFLAPSFCYTPDRTINELNLQCDTCLNWFHASCVRIDLGPVVPYIANYQVSSLSLFFSFFFFFLFFSVTLNSF